MSRSALVILAAFLAVQLLCTVGFADVETVTSPSGVFDTGWNLFALPAIPVWDGDPAHAPGYPPVVLNEWDPGDGSGLDARRLMRWEPPIQSLLQFDMYNQSEFGSLLLGHGYWVRLGPTDAKEISFQGVTDNDDTDIWISLPRTGWTLIGHPFSYPAPDADPGPPYYTGTAYPWADVKVTDGTSTKSMYGASQYGARWLRSVAFWFDSSTGSLIDLGLPSDYANEESLIAWHGYWVRSLKDDLALIVEANPEEPQPAPRAPLRRPWPPGMRVLPL